MNICFLAALTTSSHERLLTPNHTVCYSAEIDFQFIADDKKEVDSECAAASSRKTRKENIELSAQNCSIEIDRLCSTSKTRITAWRTVRMKD